MGSMVFSTADEEEDKSLVDSDEEAEEDYMDAAYDSEDYFQQYDNPDYPVDYPIDYYNDVDNFTTPEFNGTRNGTFGNVTMGNMTLYNMTTPRPTLPPPPEIEEKPVMKSGLTLPESLPLENITEAKGKKAKKLTIQASLCFICASSSRS